MSGRETELRPVQVHAGDSLRLLALRELGDALRWIELATINQLRPPYVVESVNSQDRQPGTVIWGDVIYAPIGSLSPAIQTPTDVLGIDVALPAGQLTVTAQGDYALVTANDNLGQALQHRVKTPRGDLLGHPSYGCQVSRALGLRLRPVVQVMASGFVKAAVLDDPRVDIAKMVPVAVSEAVADALHITVRVQSVARNTPLDLNFVFPVFTVV